MLGLPKPYTAHVVFGLLKLPKMIGPSWVKRRASRRGEQIARVLNDLNAGIDANRAIIGGVGCAHPYNVTICAGQIHIGCQNGASDPTRWSATRRAASRPRRSARRSRAGPARSRA